MPSSRPKTSESFGRRFKRPRRMGSQSGLSAPLDPKCLDWLLILNARHLERALAVFIDHYNGWRPHRSLDLEPPNGRMSATTLTGTQPVTLIRRDRARRTLARVRACRVSELSKRTVHDEKEGYLA